MVGWVLLVDMEYMTHFCKLGLSLICLCSFRSWSVSEKNSCRMYIDNPCQKYPGSSKKHQQNTQVAMTEAYYFLGARFPWSLVKGLLCPEKVCLHTSPKGILWGNSYLQIPSFNLSTKINVHFYPRFISAFAPHVVQDAISPHRTLRLRAPCSVKNREAVSIDPESGTSNLQPPYQTLTPTSNHQGGNNRGQRKAMQFTSTKLNLTQRQDKY